MSLVAPRETTSLQSHRIPIWVKVLYTAFVGVLVPYYWHAYGPTNFLYFCDVALFMALAAVWSENALWASTPAVGILLPQALWCADFLGGLVGWSLTGMTAYMFNPSLSLLTRSLSFFHLWLPFFLLWIIWRLGYDQRALAAWTGIAWVLMSICYFFMPPPLAPAANPHLPVNINYVYGMSDAQPQTWMLPLLYLACMMVGLPVGLFLPAHLLLQKLFGPPRSQDLPTYSGFHLSEKI